MRIGIVSDTHNNLKNVGKIVELFNESGVSRVIHTGDVTQAKTLDVLANLNAPMYGVYGNNDEERESLDAAIARHNFQFFEPPFTTVWHEREIIVVHDPLEFDGHLADHHELALHGHTHRYRLEDWGSQTKIFNPGECAGHMQGFNAIGIVDLSTLETEILKF
ncbi:MAG: YfcE family phosphodiesterase [Pseudomonadales bacterium]|nr:YfcE family phosphodiesterase [Pseudomonadales bacterium]